MYNLDKYHVRICTTHPNGVYRFGDISASGKTYLSKVLQKYRSYGEPVGAYSYLDYRDGVDLEARACGCKLFVVDRYDMYYGHALKVIQDLGKHCIVLVDVKTPRELAYARVCGLVLRVGEIIIT